MFQGYNALPVAQGHWFGVGTSAYIGVVALVLALVGAVVSRHRSDVVALVAVGVVMGAVVFVPPVASLMNQLPFRARWHLGLVVVTFVIAVLAGFGTEAVVRSPRDWTLRVWAGSGFAVAGLMVVALWVIGRGHLAPAAARLRTQSFIWPTVLTVLGLVVVAFLARGARPGAMGPVAAGGRAKVGRPVAVVFLLAETAFLVGVGAPQWSSSPTYLKPTAAEVALARAVGSATVGFGAHSCELPPTLGILPETNAAFAVHELSAYDPSTPRAYFRVFKLSSGILVSAFCPVVKTAAQARLYGVGFILEPKGAPQPPGAEFDTTIGDEDLYRVPGAAAATVVAVTGTATRAGPSAAGTAVTVTYPDPSSWRIVTEATSPEDLRLRLTDVPGWRATIDGHPLDLQRFGGIMLQARIPAGSHTVEVRYWPRSFSLGIALAAVSVGGLAAATVMAWRRRRSRVGAGPFGGTG